MYLREKYVMNNKTIVGKRLYYWSPLGKFTCYSSRWSKRRRQKRKWKVKYKNKELHVHDMHLFVHIYKETWTFMNILAGIVSPTLGWQSLVGQHLICNAITWDLWPYIINTRMGFIWVYSGESESEKRIIPIKLPVNIRDIWPLGEFLSK